MGDYQKKFKHFSMNQFIANLCTEKEPCEQTLHEVSTKELQKLRKLMW